MPHDCSMRSAALNVFFLGSESAAFKSSWQRMDGASIWCRVSLVVHDRSLGRQTMTWASKNEFKSCQGSGCASKAQPPPKRPRDGEEVPGPAVCVFGATCKAMLLRKVLQEVCLALVLQALTWFVFLDLEFETRPFRTAVLANSRWRARFGWPRPAWRKKRHLVSERSKLPWAAM